MNTIIAAAVEPIRTLAVAEAKKQAEETIERLAKKMAENFWNLDAVAPRPNSLKDGRREYQTKKAVRAAYENIFTIVPRSSFTYEPHRPVLLQRDSAREERFIKTCMEAANAQFDSYVAKLTAKVGEVVEAELTAGRHVWGFSVLSVKKPDGSREDWKTQQIMNVSVYGKLFNQWPTRKVK